MSMKFLTLGAISLIVVSCARPDNRPEIPVPVGCPEAEIEAAGERPALPLEGINDTTPVDVAARAYKAALLELIVFTRKLELERDGWRDAYRICQSVRNDLQPSPEER
jgi:hypothetical protein